jgi:hypothetical protein
MASYPTSIVAFSTHNTGDTIQPADVNAPNAEIVAIETGLENGFQHALLPLNDDTYAVGSTAKRWLKVWSQDADFDGTTTLATANVTDIYTNFAWQDYSATSSITGWASFTSKSLFYKQIGKFIFIAFNFQGTSNSTSTNFSVPAVANATNPQFNFPCFTQDNGAAVAGFAQLVAGSATVNAYSTYAAAAWTASGTKILSGQFFYSI